MGLNLIEQLRTEGYAVTRNVLLAREIKSVDWITAELIRKWERGEIASKDFWTYKPQESPRPVLYRIHKLEQKHRQLRDFIDSESVLEMVRSVMGQNVVNSAAALIIKMPFFGGRVPYHRDPIDVPPGTVFNFSFFLDDSTEENGCFEVIPGSHLTNEGIERSEEKPKNAKYVCSKKFDVLVHDVRVIHGSAYSKSNIMRRSICLEFKPLD